MPGEMIRFPVNREEVVQVVSVARGWVVVRGKGGARIIHGEEHGRRINEYLVAPMATVEASGIIAPIKERNRRQRKED